MLNLVTSNDGEGTSILSPVAVIDHGTWLPFGNASYHDGSNNPPEALSTVREDKNYISSIGPTLVLVAFFFFYHIFEFNDGVYCLHAERIFNYSFNRSVIFVHSYSNISYFFIQSSWFGG